MYSTTSVMPPLKIWLALAAISGAVAIGLLAMASVYERREYDSKQAYLDKMLGTPGSTSKIVFLGSSLTQCGLDSGQSIENQICSQSGKNVTIVKLWRRATSLKQLSAKLLENRKIQPDLLIVESNMLLYNATPITIQFKLSLALRQLRRKTFKTAYNADEKPKFEKFDNRPIDDFRGALVDTTELEAFRSELSRLNKMGTRVIFIHFPIERDEEKQKWLSADTAIFRQNLDYLSREVAYQFWKPTLVLDSSFFRDRAHMNDKGANVMTAWLSNSIASEFPGL